jgi:hypothetical protein
MSRDAALVDSEDPTALGVALRRLALSIAAAFAVVCGRTDVGMLRFSLRGMPLEPSEPRAGRSAQVGADRQALREESLRRAG